MSMSKAILAAALCAALAACASEPRREFRHRGPQPGGLFISPSGEPFRGGDGLAAWFAGADADHDGAVTLAEFAADALRFFKRLDVNGDGVVDGFEMQAYEQTIAPEIAALDLERRLRAAGRDAEGAEPPADRGGRRRGGGFRPGGGRGPGGEREGAARYSLINEPEPVTNADENLDGRVTLEEWRHAAERRFNVLDRDRAGRLTLEALRGRPGARPRR